MRTAYALDRCNRSMKRTLVLAATIVAAALFNTMVHALDIGSTITVNRKMPACIDFGDALTMEGMDWLNADRFMRSRPMVDVGLKFGPVPACTWIDEGSRMRAVEDEDDGWLCFEFIPKYSAPAAADSPPSTFKHPCYWIHTPRR
jgi:hypothetical protein